MGEFRGCFVPKAEVGKYKNISFISIVLHVSPNVFPSLVISNPEDGVGFVGDMLVFLFEISSWFDRELISQHMN